jgi:hypothetical protein
VKLDDPSTLHITFEDLDVLSLVTILQFHRSYVGMNVIACASENAG